jgi:ribose 5-phosphate isomerase B
MMEKIAVGADHAGFEYKELLKKWLEKNGYALKDFGAYTTDSADYPDFAHPVASALFAEVPTE